MKRLAVVFALLALEAGSAIAGTRSCTAGMVTLNICRSTSDVAYCLPISTVDPDSGGPLLAPSALVADAFAVTGGWQTPTTCTAEMVTAGICSSGQLGSSVSITKAQFADLQVRSFVMRTVRQYLRNQQITQASAAADAAPDPDIGQ